ncbi:hypothetical protein Sjap_001480 [Stephania japonica]|uniref:Ubiquitin-like domain-containing protein n=1 Tax=Stephania japonica TaxID=461633 RepID=A0AAP0PTB9_9MAGN
MKKNPIISRRILKTGRSEEIGWEVRPGGMLVQKRDDNEDGVCGSRPMIKIKVSSHGSYHHEIAVPAQSTIGDLKILLFSETGLEPKEQRLLFQGKERENEECLHMIGIKDMSKVVLLEDPASREKKLQAMKRDNGISVSVLESAVHSGTKLEEKEFVVLTELLMLQLLKLDGIEAEGKVKVQRRVEVSA